MGLEEKVGDSLKSNKEFLIASGTYIMASAADYLATVRGIDMNKIVEVNPIINDYINQFGVEHGVLIPKVIIGAGVLLGLKCVDSKLKDKEVKVKAKHILYGGALLTALTGTSWMVFDYISKIC
ncbi:hypothetical protein ACFL96_05900 [Thermoproteota archaeon]